MSTDPPRVHPDWCCEVIRNRFLPQLELLREVLARRLLPTFDTVPEEAEAVAHESWLNSSPFRDPADVADDAHDEGVARYVALMEVRQSVINLFAVALQHLLEQQEAVLVRRGIVISSGYKRPLERLLERPNRPKATDRYLSVLRELRLVANVAKHAEGNSLDQLRLTASQMLVPPEVRHSDDQDSWSGVPVETPLAGDGIYVTKDDFERYFKAAVAMWHDLETVLSAPPYAV